MRSWRTRGTVLAIALGATLLTASCFGGGQSAAQATATSATAAGTTPSPAASPPRLPSPQAGASPAASPSPTLAAGEQAYTVEAGDTLGSIAQKFYGDSSQWRKIYDANRSALGDNPDAIKPGTQIRIPPKD